MMRGRITRAAYATGLGLATLLASSTEAADFQARRPSSRVVPARYLMQAETSQPTEAASSLPQEGEVIYENVSPEEFETYGEPMMGPYASPPQGSFPYPNRYTAHPNRSHGSFAPQSHYYGYYPTCWRRWPEGWGCPTYQTTATVTKAPAAEELPKPAMPTPANAGPAPQPSTDGYGPTPGETAAPAPGGMTPDAPTKLPENEIPQQPMPLEDGPPAFPTDQLGAPGLPSDGMAPGLPTDSTPLNPPTDNARPPAAPPTTRPGGAAPSAPTPLAPPPGLPTDNSAPGIPDDDSLPPP
ncbi:MAG: hypothetical protein KDA63_11335, partial [Planctomycetales bacterium]|nr:hypothetical protein [Planctomycetales bacterium]